MARFGALVMAVTASAALAAAGRPLLAATDHTGEVTFNTVPVPGATVTATRGERQVIAVTGPDGAYRLQGLDEGEWTLRVEMRGFATIERVVAVRADELPTTWELALLSLEEIRRERRSTDAAASVQEGAAASGAPSSAASTSGERAGGGTASSGFQRAAVTTPPRRESGSGAPVPAEEPPADLGFGAADGFLINGSVNNGAASPFAQPAAFGNNRRRPGSLYTGGLGLLGGHSAWDARPFSFSGQRVPKDDYRDLHLLGTLGGPLRIPRLRNDPTFFIGYQRASDTNARTRSSIVPTALERRGDFSETRDGFGRPVSIADPRTGAPFPGNAIPADRISPQAAALLGYYPEPNLENGGRFNFQAPVISGTRQDSLQTRINQFINPRNQLAGTIAYQRTTTDTTTAFGFEDRSEVSGLDTSAIWTRRLSQFFSLRLRHQFTQQTRSAVPYFAGRTNVAVDAGIAGTNQEPVNWGPPTLSFASGIETLTDERHAFTRSRANGAVAEVFLNRGRHNLTFGGELRRHDIAIRAQQDPRGTFAFTGAYTGSDLADFLLGIPRTSSIAFGNADKDLRGMSYAGYVTDDLRLSAGLTFNLGLRWELDTPLTEALGRLVNLDVAPGFAAAVPVLAGAPSGPLTGRAYPSSLIHVDRGGFQPRLAMAWRPLPASSLLVRAGYGIYRNTAVYQPLATRLAQQPPLSTTFSVENDLVSPSTLANALLEPGTGARNTFAVDPDFRVGYAHNWQVSVQRDLPASLTVIAAYLGVKGRHLPQQVLPNTFPPGAANPCPSCPSGFAYVTSNGRSSRHAGQLTLRRRLRNGLTASLQYTLANAKDDATSFTTVSLASSAQDWLDLEAEYGPSSFDQRHLVSAQLQYTTGMGLSGGTLVDGVRGALWKGWTLTAQLTAGSGLPATPLYLTNVPGTGVVGVRADVTGAVDEIPEGYYLNPAAYSAPEPGRWGSAGRNSVRGPAQFGLNAGLGRTFPWGDRLNLEWRVDATNVLNRVTYANVNTIVGSPQFGLPTLADPMRKVQTSVRLRF